MANSVENTTNLAVVENRLQGIEDQLSTLNKLLLGNGDPSSGIVVRLDRVEQEAGNKKYWLGNVVLIAMSSTIGILVERFLGGK